MVFVTGDCHGSFERFDEGRSLMLSKASREDIVIVCGDFGLWHDDDSRETINFEMLSEKPFLIAFVDGNHENFDRIYSDEFEVIDFKGGKAHKIRENILHLMRGHIFNFEGQSFFCMGGAMSHDIRDGIFDMNNYPSADEAIAEYNKWRELGKQFRVNHLSWWKEEIPSKEEMDFGRRSLGENNYEVDYVISHCLPQSVAASIGFSNPDPVSNYFDELLQNGMKFKRWYCGHYHQERSIWGKFIIKHFGIERII